MRNRSFHPLYVAVLLIALPAAPALVAGSLDTPTPWGSTVMQEYEDAPIWSALRALDHTPAQWATLLTTDADDNHRTDFLDLVVRAAGPSNAHSVSVELLAHVPSDALPDILEEHEGSVEIHGEDAVFLTAKLADLDGLEAAGATELVWMPRTHSTAGPGHPLPQHTIHQADDAWGPLDFNGTGVRIAVLDSGIDDGHDAFSAPGKVADWEDCVFDADWDDTAPHDPNGHGSHVASIAAGDDGPDFRGVAYGASLVGVRVLDAAGSGSLADFQCGVDFVRALHLAGGAPIVATASLGLAVPPLGVTTLNGGQVDVFLFDRVAELLPLAGVPFTVASGNHLGVIEILDVDEGTQVGVNGVNQVSSPGFATGVITVGAVTEFEARAVFSAIGPGKVEAGDLQVKPDLVAHGSDTWGAEAGTSSGYVQLDGTSMATPGAAGVAALLLQKQASLTPSDVKDALHGGAENAWLVTGFASEPLNPNFSTGHGVAKAANSLALV